LPLTKSRLARDSLEALIALPICRHWSTAVSNPKDLLEEYQADLESSDFDEETVGIDRRQFVFLSLAAAAATTLGIRPARAQAGGRAGSTAGTAGAAGQPGLQQQEAPLPLGNGEPPALQFQPYPGGTGALMEKLVRQRGAAAFDRGTYEPQPWTGAVPASDDDIAFLPAHRLSALIKSRRITSARLTDIYLTRLKRLNPTLLCAVTIMEDQARAEAARADAEIAAGRYRGPLHGLPYGIKDLFATKGVPTTWGAKDFENRIIDLDAEVVVRLRDAGAVLIAKLATGLFAQNDQWFRGRTNNPWNLSQGSSGSSAGPASATAAGCVAFGIGTETSGSIVSPTIRCGLSALRPTFGSVSRYGGMVLSWSQDRVGPIARTSEDAAMVFNVIHGADEKDPSTVTMPFQFNRAIDLGALRIGVDDQAPKELVDKLRELGMKPVSIGPRPTVPGIGNTGGLDVEYAAAFDSYVQVKAKQIGLDLNNLPPLPARGAGGAGAGAGGGAGAGAGAGGRGAAPADPMAPADWNPRFVNGRRIPGFEFLQTERRRYVLISKWAEFLKDLDMYIGSPFADIGANAQTGHPSTVLPYKFGVPQQFGGRRGATPAEPVPALNAQPICGQIIGNLYHDDLILSVAHQFQMHDDTVQRHPKL
jgi:Asp-tRNA(Asn)/Glu-tRNA(Gln) amidotransferase A subunit family amidase